MKDKPYTGVVPNTYISDPPRTTPFHRLLAHINALCIKANNDGRGRRKLYLCTYGQVWLLKNKYDPRAVFARGAEQRLSARF